MQMNLATVAVLHTAMALEDPFDNQGLDGIYIDEALFEAEQVMHLISLLVDSLWIAMPSCSSCFAQSGTPATLAS